MSTTTKLTSVSARKTALGLAARAGVSALGLAVGLMAAPGAALAADPHYVSVNDGGVPAPNYNNDGATGSNATAVGINAQASGNSSTAVGINATATHNSTTAIGHEAKALGDSATAIGWNAQATKTDTTAVGTGSHADGERSAAFGVNSKAAKEGTALGNEAEATGNSSTAVGFNAVATHNSATAIGHDAAALGDSATAIGWGAKATRTDSTAVGNGSLADGERSAAFGFDSRAMTNDSLAFGSKAQAGANAGDVALGSGSVTSAVTATTGTTINGTSYGFAGTAPTSMLSVGSLGNERVIANVAAGRVSATSTDAVNGSQLNATNQAVDALGGKVNTLGSSTAAYLGGGATYDASTGQIGGGFTVSGTTYTDVASAITATNNQVATNTTNITNLQQDVANNTTNITNLQQNIANGTIGLVQQAGGSNGAITVGAATGGTSIDLSGTSGARTVSGVAAGVASNDAVNVAQLESAILAASQGKIVYDNSNQTSVTFNNGGNAATLSNVAAGNVNSTSTQAVNGSQLYSTNQAIAALAAGDAGAFQSNNSSGRADPNAAGVDAVAGGFGAVASGARSTAVGSGATASGTNSVALGYNSTDGGLSNVVSVGSVGGERQIVNVAAGTRATDAVNVGQMNTGLANTLAQANGYTNSQVAAIRFDMNKLRNQADAGVASAMAVAGLPQAYTAGRGMVAGAMGVYRDRTAFAIGLSKALVDGHTVVKGGATYTSYGNTFGANFGIGYQF